MHVQGRRPSRRLRIDLQIDVVGRHVAQTQPREIQRNLLCAKAIELQPNLSSARAKRARELTELIANALTHVERVMFFTEGDRC